MPASVTRRDRVTKQHRAPLVLSIAALTIAAAVYVAGSVPGAILGLLIFAATAVFWAVWRK